MNGESNKKLPLRYRWERDTGIDAHMKKWVGFDGDRQIGFIHESHMGGFQWYQTWPAEAFGPSLPATGGIEANANLACVAVERTYDIILDGKRPGLSEQVQAKAREMGETSWVRRGKV